MNLDFNFISYIRKIKNEFLGNKKLLSEKKSINSDNKQLNKKKIKFSTAKFFSDKTKFLNYSQYKETKDLDLFSDSLENISDKYYNRKHKNESDDVDFTIDKNTKRVKRNLKFNKINSNVIKTANDYEISQSEDNKKNNSNQKISQNQQISSKKKKRLRPQDLGVEVEEQKNIELFNKTISFINYSEDKFDKFEFLNKLDAEKALKSCIKMPSLEVNFRKDSNKMIFFNEKNDNINNDKVINSMSLNKHSLHREESNNNSNKHIIQFQNQEDQHNPINNINNVSSSINNTEKSNVRKDKKNTFYTTNKKCRLIENSKDYLSTYKKYKQSDLLLKDLNKQFEFKHKLEKERSERRQKMNKTSSHDNVKNELLNLGNDGSPFLQIISISKYVYRLVFPLKNFIFSKKLLKFFIFKI